MNKNILSCLRLIKRVPSSSMGLNSSRAFASEATFQTKPFKMHRLEDSPNTEVTVNHDDALKFYREMQAMRRLETASGNLYKEKIVRGFCHLYSGQEACAVGMKAAMRPHDAVISAYRVHGWTYLMGVSIEGILAELCGRSKGCSRGKGGSMHMYAPNFYGGNGIVGAQVPLGAGVALAAKYKGTDGVCISLYGDGAANQGQVFEAYNMAALWNLPILFVCENNGYGMGTSTDRAAAATTYYTRGDYIPGMLIDGMDVLAVREGTKFAINYAASGKGPLVLEVATYRYSGHSMSDPGTSYRTRDEVQEVRQTRDPITSFKEKITSSGLVTAEELKKIDSEVKAEVDNAVKSAKADVEVGMEDLVGDIYVNSLEPYIRGVHPWSRFNHVNIGKPLNV